MTGVGGVVGVTGTTTGVCMLLFVQVCVCVVHVAIAVKLPVDIGHTTESLTL